jgi:methionyl-tRNA formyltransferase
MILNSEIAIEPDENAGQLHDRLMQLGSKTVIDTLKVIETGNVNTTIQEDSEEIKTAYKLNKENCKIDWTKSGVKINNLIRGLSPYPASSCFLKDKDEELSIKIYEAKLVSEAHSCEIGKLICGKKEIKVAVQDGFLHLLSLQLPGKKRMQVAELLNGITFSEDANVY